MPLIPTCQHIPNILHFVWAGGAASIPESACKNLLMWADFAANSSTTSDPPEIWLWVDSFNHLNRRAHKTLAQTASRYLEIFRVCANTFSRGKLRTIGSIRQDGAQIVIVRYDGLSAKIKFSDVISSGMASAAAKYEMYKLEPDFGASSDLIRYRILYNYGGCYVDFDILPDADLRLASEGISQLADPCPDLCFLDFTADKESQETRYPNLNQRAQLCFGNDAIIATRFNAFVKEILREAEKSYFITSLPLHRERAEQYSVAYCSWSIYLRTIDRTGPGCVGRVLSKALKEQACEHDRTSLYWPNNTQEYCLVLPLRSRVVTRIFRPRNTRLWINPQKEERVPTEELLSRVNYTIEFEHSRFKVLRHESHFTQAESVLSRDCNKSNLVKKHISEFVRKKLNEKESKLVTPLEVIATPSCYDFHWLERLGAESIKHDNSPDCRTTDVLLVRELVNFDLVLNINRHLSSYLKYCSDEIPSHVATLSRNTSILVGVVAGWVSEITRSNDLDIDGLRAPSLRIAYMLRLWLRVMRKCRKRSGIACSTNEFHIQCSLDNALAVLT